MFVNNIIEQLFPCTAGWLLEYYPVCKLVTYEDNGFRRGHAVIDTADRGNDIHVFSDTNIATYGFAFTGCPILSLTNASQIVLSIVLYACSLEIDVDNLT